MGKVLIACAGCSHSLLRAIIDVLMTQDGSVLVVDENGTPSKKENIFLVRQTGSEYPINIFLPHPERLWLKENERDTCNKKKSKWIARKNLCRRHSVNRGK